MFQFEGSDEDKNNAKQVVGFLINKYSDFLQPILTDLVFGILLRLKTVPYKTNETPKLGLERLKVLEFLTRLISLIRKLIEVERESIAFDKNLVSQLLHSLQHLAIKTHHSSIGTIIIKDLIF